MPLILFSVVCLLNCFQLPFYNSSSGSMILNSSHTFCTRLSLALTSLKLCSFTVHRNVIVDIFSPVFTGFCAFTGFSVLLPANTTFFASSCDRCFLCSSSSFSCSSYICFLLCLSLLIFVFI